MPSSSMPRLDLLSLLFADSWFVGDNIVDEMNTNTDEADCMKASLHWNEFGARPS